MYKIAISSLALRRKIADDDAAMWGKLNDSFENQEVEVTDLADAIYTGRSFTTWHKHERIWIVSNKHPEGGYWSKYRHQKNFICGQHIAVDLDTEDSRSSIETVERNHFYRMYGGLIYATPSHTPAKPRCRAVFFLDEPICTGEGYKVAADVVSSFIDGADRACVDYVRSFFGNANLQSQPENIRLNDGVLPLQELRRYARQLNILRQREQAAAMQTANRPTGKPVAKTAYAQSAFQKELQQLAATKEGGRNHQLFKSAAALGNFIGAGLLSEDEVATHLSSAAQSIGLDVNEIAKTLASGLRSGMQQPREVH